MSPPNLPASLARALFKLKRSDVLDMPLSPGDLARCVAALFADNARRFVAGAALRELVDRTRGY